VGWFSGKRRALAVLATAGFVALAGCRSAPTPQRSSANVLHDNAITVGSFDFAESDLLGEIYSEALEARGYHVQRAFHLGPRELVAPALARGLLELVPEYAGTALQFTSLGTRVATADVSATRDALIEALAPEHITALAPAAAQDANTFVVTRRTADREGLRTLSDLARVAPKLSFGGPPECPERDQCLRGLQRVYGARFKEFVRLDAGGPVTRQALNDGYIDAALLFTTDPEIAHDHLVELVDDRGLERAENVIPLVREELISRFGPTLVHTVDAVSARLTTAVLTNLNARVANGDLPAVVAANWLKGEELQ